MSRYNDDTIISEMERLKSFPPIVTKMTNDRLEYRTCNKCGRRNRKKYYDITIPYMDTGMSNTLHLCRRCLLELIKKAYLTYKSDK